jgi:hypothetical protein
MGDLFGQYSRDITAWNTQNPYSRVEAGPFDVITREELADFFGYEVVQMPPSHGERGNMSGGGTPATPAVTFAPPPAPTPTPVTEPRAPAGPDPPSPTATPDQSNENEYLRRVLNARVRNEEEFAKP